MLRYCRFIEHRDVATLDTCVNSHTAVNSSLADMNSKMGRQRIEDQDIVVVTYASFTGCNIIPRSGLLKDDELCSSSASKQSCFNCHRYFMLHLYADGEKRCSACVRR